MPTYDYQCEKCGHAFEFFQSMKDDRLTDCPQESCDGKVKRLIGTGAGIIFKGTGFYETDYRSDSYKAAAKADSGSGSGGDSGGGNDGGGGGGSGNGDSSSPSSPSTDSSRAGDTGKPATSSSSPKSAAAAGD